MFRKIIILLTLIQLVVNVSCKKKSKTVQDPVPYQTVNINIYPNDPLNFKIQSIGGWMYFTGGVNGIVVYRKTMQDFVAIERTSTYFPDNAGAAVKVQSDNFTLKDTVSGSKWQITDGTVLQGPASIALRQYSTFYDSGTGVLNVRN